MRCFKGGGLRRPFVCSRPSRRIARCDDARERCHSWRCRWTASRAPCSSRSRAARRPSGGWLSCSTWRRARPPRRPQRPRRTVDATQQGRQVRRPHFAARQHLMSSSIATGSWCWRSRACATNAQAQVAAGPAAAASRGAAASGRGRTSRKRRLTTARPPRTSWLLPAMASVPRPRTAWCVTRWPVHRRAPFISTHPLCFSRCPASRWQEYDGGSRGNPGVTGWGAVVREHDTGLVVAVCAGWKALGTNNEAEYSAALQGLQASFRRTRHMLSQPELFGPLISRWRVRVSIGACRWLSSWACAAWFSRATASW